MFSLDDEEDELQGLYENGRWVWDKNVDKLVFVSDLPSTGSTIPPASIIGPIEFNDDIDLLEQQKFKKRFQRKATEEDIVTLQDVKDVVLYTAPENILTPAVINVLHLPMTERFLRSLILYMQYYLQISDQMHQRSLEQVSRIRTPNSVETEKEFRDEIEDLRLLVAKEYCVMIVGGGGYSKFHHMGPSKKSRSVSRKDALFFETVIRITVQIVWLSLGRKNFDQIELEIHRLFKSATFNVAEHKKKAESHKMTAEEQFVLLGHCVRQDNRNINRSPFLNEVTCNRVIDFKTFGLGVIKYKNLDDRQRYMEKMLVADEELLSKTGLSLGIIGLPRNKFDIMLREIVQSSSSAASTMGRSSSVRSRSASRSSKASLRKSTGQAQKKPYPDQIIPKKNKFEEEPVNFPVESFPPKPNRESQKMKWLLRVERFAAGRGKKKALCFSKNES